MSNAEPGVGDFDRLRARAEAAEASAAVLRAILQEYAAEPIGPMVMADAVMVLDHRRPLYERARAVLEAGAAASTAYRERLIRERDAEWRENVYSLAEATDNLEIRGYGLALVVRMEAKPR